MVIDDHDMHDDWNISESWCEEMEREPWWRERVVGGMMAYWVYQFVGNLSPRELRERPLWNRVREAATTPARCCASSWNATTRSARASGGRSCRDLGTTRSDRDGRAHRPLPRAG